MTKMRANTLAKRVNKPAKRALYSRKSKTTTVTDLKTRPATDVTEHRDAVAVLDVTIDVTTGTDSRATSITDHLAVNHSATVGTDTATASAVGVSSSGNSPLEAAIWNFFFASTPSVETFDDSVTDVYMIDETFQNPYWVENITERFTIKISIPFVVMMLEYRLHGIS